MADNKRGFDDSSSSSPNKKMIKSNEKNFSSSTAGAGSGLSNTSNKKSFQRNLPPYRSVVVYDLKRAKEVLEDRSFLSHMFISLKEGKTPFQIDREEIESICEHQGIYLEEVSGIVYEFQSYEEAERTVFDFRQKDDKTNLHVIIGPDVKWQEGDLMQALCDQNDYSYTVIPGRRGSGSSYKSIAIYDLKKAKQVLEEKEFLTHMFLLVKEPVSELEEIKSICKHRRVYE